MNETLKNVKTYSRIGSLVKFAKNDYKKGLLNELEFREVLNDCEKETHEIKDTVNSITNQIKIPFNY